MIDVLIDWADFISDSWSFTLPFIRFRRQTYITPKTYLFLLKCYDTLYADRRQELRTMQNQLSVGLDKMQEAAEAAEEMGKILAVQAKDVEKVTIRAKAVMVTVQIALAEADKVRSVVVVVYVDEVVVVVFVVFSVVVVAKNYV